MADPDPTATSPPPPPPPAVAFNPVPPVVPVNGVQQKLNVYSLSNGDHLALDPNLPPDQVSSRLSAAEDQLGQAQAAKIGGPFASGERVHSSTGSYPNTGGGRYRAWLDENAGGNAVNRAASAVTGSPTAQAIGGTTIPLTGGATISDAAKGLGQSLYRTSLAGPGILDALGHAVNLVRGVGGYPYDSTKFMRDFGDVPPAPNTATALAEGAGQAMLTAGAAGAPFSPVANTIATGTGAGGAALGRAIGGPGLGGEWGELAGGLLGGSAAIPRLAAEPLGRYFAHENAPEIYQAGQASDIPLSFRTLANPTGQRIAATLGSVPVTGAPIENANDATRAAIMAVRDQTAADIAGRIGIPPLGASPESIGATLTQGAQAAIPRIQTAQSALWDPINQTMVGRSVDVSPVVRSLDTRLQQQPTTPSIEAAVRAPVNELASTAPGAPGGQVQGPPSAPGALDVPWSTVKDFRTGLTQDLGKGPVSVPGNITADIKGATTDAMRNATLQAGLPATGPGSFDVARESYANTQPLLDRLYGIGGQPLGQSGQFINVPGEKTAAGELTRNLQSPRNLDIFTDPRTFDPAAWQSASGQLISTLGERKPGEFRPEHFAEDWGKIGPDVRTQLTQSQTGAPTTALTNLENAATVGRNFVTPQARHGLISSLVASDVVRHALAALSAAGGSLAGTKEGLIAGGLGYGVPALASYGASRMLESPAMKSAMARQPINLAPTAAGAIPRFAPITNILRPEQQ